MWIVDQMERVRVNVNKRVIYKYGKVVLTCGRIMIPECGEQLWNNVNLKNRGSNIIHNALKMSSIFKENITG